MLKQNFISTKAYSQKEALLEVFDTVTNPDKEVCEQLSQELGISVDQVRSWFANQRQKRGLSADISQTKNCETRTTFTPEQFNHLKDEFKADYNCDRTR